MFDKLKVPIIIASVLAATTVTAIAVTARTPQPPVIGQTSAEYQFYPLHQATLQRLSQLLGLTTQEITAQLGQGKTLLDIAGSKNVADDRLVTTLVAPEAEILQVQVKNGYLTESQARTRLDSIRARAGQTVRFSWSSNAVAPGTFSYGMMMDPAECPMQGGWTTGNNGTAAGQGWGMMGGGMMGGSMMGRW